MDKEQVIGIYDLAYQIYISKCQSNNVPSERIHLLGAVLRNFKLEFKEQLEKNG